MKDHIYNEQNGLHYTLHGDVYLPDLVYSKTNYLPFGKMLLCDELWPHLLEVEQQAHTMLETMVMQMAKAEGVTESMKSTDPLRWIGLMNSFKSAEEEIILREVVYA